MANRIEQFLIEKSDPLFRARYDRYFVKELRRFESRCDMPMSVLSPEQKKEIRDYYAERGFRNIRTDWHRYILSTSGRWSPQMVPENFYHLILEKIYNDLKVNDWEDKAYMTTFLPDVQFPTTLFANVNGYFIDSRREIISREEAAAILRKEGQAFVKPTRASGGGRNAAVIGPEKMDDTFEKLGKNFIVQRIVKQHPETAAFNPSSVNTEKILSFLFQGEVYVLSSFIRVGEPGAVIDNASYGDGFMVGIRANGEIEPVGMNIYGRKRDADFHGNPLSGRKLTYHKDICEIIKRAHKKLPYFGFITWDFCVTDKGEPLLIEYNTNSAVPFTFQMTNGPLFGDMLHDVLRDARKYSDSIRYVR